MKRLLAILFLASLPVLRASDAPAKPSNIITMMADDLG